MGEYYKWVNVDKKEYLDPVDFDLNSKWHGSMTREDPMLMALYQLLDTNWKNDHVLFMGDERHLSDSTNNPALSKLYAQTVEYGYPGSINDLVCDTYKNVSPLFKAAEAEVRAEIESCIMYPEYSMSEHILETYGFDLDKPYQDMFLKEGKRFKYIINYTKMAYYSFDVTKIYFQNGNLDADFDPLPQLLGFGNYMGYGEWLGDIIGVTDDSPKNLMPIGEIVLDW